MQWFFTVASVPKRQVIDETLKKLTSYASPKYKQHYEIFPFNFLDIDLLNRSSDDKVIYAAIKQRIVEYIKVYTPKSRLTQQVTQQSPSPPVLIVIRTDNSKSKTNTTTFCCYQV